jgi:hypothetical protein
MLIVADYCFHRSIPRKLFGRLAGWLVRKLVRHTKVLCSWSANEPGFDQLRFPQTKPYIGTAAAGVLRKRMPLWGRKCADSICRIVALTRALNSRRCWSVIVVLGYWISTRRLRTNTTWATSEIPVIQSSKAVGDQEPIIHLAFRNSGLRWSSTPAGNRFHLVSQSHPHRRRICSLPRVGARP